MSDQPSVRSIAVVYGDNDFGNTFVPLLETIRRAVRHRLLSNDRHDFRHTLSRPILHRLVQEGAQWHYLAFQLRPDRDHPVAEHRRAYPRDPLSVRFDEEADRAVGSEDHNHAAWYVRFDDDNPVISF